VLGGIVLAAVALLGLVIWLGWRGPADGDRKAHAATPAAIDTANTSALTVHPADAHLPDNDRVWKPNPGGETLYASSGKPSAGSPVVFASKVDLVVGRKDAGSQPSARRSPSSSLLSDLETKVAANVVTSHGEVGAQPNSEPVEAAAVEAPAISAGGTSQPSLNLNGVLSAKASLPALTVPVSQGVTGGELIRRVSPIYPSQARSQRLEGTVVLAATVMEDGTVRDVKVVQGSPVLAQPAVDAVKRWRYQPFVLDGKPVKNSVVINIDFTFPKN
jgi:TonB family protein